MLSCLVKENTDVISWMSHADNYLGHVELYSLGKCISYQSGLERQAGRGSSGLCGEGIMGRKSKELIF